jgi:hypothetical protein
MLAPAPPMLWTPDAMRRPAGSPDLPVRTSHLFGIPLNPERRRTFGLVCLVWFATATLFVIPYLVQAEQLRWGVILSHYAICGIAMVLTLPLLLSIAATARLPRAFALGLSVLAVLSMSAALSSLDIAVFDAITRSLHEAFAVGQKYSTRWFSNFAVYTSQISLIATAFWTLETLAMNRRRAIELEEMKTAAANATGAANAAKLSALRYQLNPHFLFNTLNSISSLVLTGRNERAEAMLTQLSDFLRVTLVADPNERQTLERELETIDSYLAIERIRFGERLAVEIDCPRELREAEMPGFLLQPLVENAVKYGVAESERLVTIRIEATRALDDLIVVVEDDGKPIAPGSGGTGIGLANVSERLKALYGDRGRVETVRRETGFLSIVRLPFRTLE